MWFATQQPCRASLPGNFCRERSGGSCNGLRGEALPSAASSILLGSNQALRNDRMGWNPGGMLPLPVSARIGAARAAPPVQGRNLVHRNPLVVDFVGFIRV